MDNSGNDTKHTMHIAIRMNFVRNGEDWNIHHKVWFEGGLNLAYIGAKNVRGDILNTILGYSMVRHEDW